ncbi:MAG: AAA family ATPase [Deltaproteobacteria bacterium]|nr:AAA family ATPase [Deltaproteobacteria bacterium]
MENYIRKVKIRSLFEVNNNLEIQFVEKTNCIFGENGTGKTTIINLIVSTLNCDLKILSSIPFVSIEIMTAKIGTKRARKSIFVNKINNEEIEFHIYEKNIHEKFNTQLDQRVNLKKISIIIDGLNDILNLTYVPLNRLNSNDLNIDHPEEYILNRALRARHLPNEEVLGILDPSRRMLSSIEKEFINRYALIQDRINKDSDEMKNNIVRRTLIDDDFLQKSDEFSTKIQSKRSIGSKKYDPTEIMKKFKHANIDISSEPLENHFRLWEKVTNEFELARDKYDNNDKSSLREFTQTYYRKFSMLVLFEKFTSILSDIEKLENNKNRYLKQFNETEEIINEFFLPRKSFEFDNKGAFLVKSNGKNVELFNLSSGEKHLIALLGRVSLLSSDASVFVADEPELSLHLEWQRPLIKSMRKLSPYLQIIVATHSPAIIPSDSNQIDLEDCKI